jgi:PAS domain-containing protein
MPLAIANFGADRRLTHYNSAYAQLWSLDEAWLDSHPKIDEILDRLRRAGKLPEQRDFRGWKEEHMRPFTDRTRYVEEVWHASNEKSIRLQAQPHLDGGVFYIFEDISEHVRLTTKLTLLSKVQRAILDAIDEPIAIFDPNGRLATHNTAFLHSWQLAEGELADGPHFSKVASLCTQRKGRDAIWDIVSAALLSGEVEGYAEWGKVTRADGRIIAVSLSHLPNGAIVVMLKDVTDLERFTEALAEGAPAAA